jgi:hypothetical protein
MLGQFATMVLAAGAILTAGSALAAEDAAVPLRLIGEAPAMGAGEARHFVIDARVTQRNGYPEIKGWLAALPPETGYTFIAGLCHDGDECTLAFYRETRRIRFTGNLLGSHAEIRGRFEISAGRDGEASDGAVTFTPFTDVVPGVGALVKPDAVDSPALNDLLLWNAPTADLNVTAGPIDEADRELLAEWQVSQGRPGTGLLLASDLELLTQHRASRQKTLGWTSIAAADKAWSAGYPAALMHRIGGAGGEQRFASADGKAGLTIAIDPPVDKAGLDRLIEALIEDPEGKRTDMHAGGTGPDQVISYVERGKMITQIYRSRKSGLARLTFSYPDGNKVYAEIAPLVSLSLSVADEVQPAP